MSETLGIEKNAVIKTEYTTENAESHLSHRNSFDAINAKKIFDKRATIVRSNVEQDDTSDENVFNGNMTTTREPYVEYENSKNPTEGNPKTEVDLSKHVSNEQQFDTSSDESMDANETDRLIPDAAMSNDLALQERVCYMEVEANFEVKEKDLLTETLIGEGFFGDVYKGKLTLPSNETISVAAKRPKRHQELDIKRARNKRKRQRAVLRAELKIMAYLQNETSGGHYNVIKLVGAMTTSPKNFSVLTEFCEWGSLDRFLQQKFDNGAYVNEISGEKYQKKGEHTTYWKSEQDSTWEENFQIRRNSGQITTSDMMWFALQIARAFQFLTKMKVIHRDVALRNVLLKSDYTVKVADFGLARRLYEVDDVYKLLTNGSILPIRCLAFESLAYNQFTVKSECWSFGIVIWELFTFSKQEPYTAEIDNNATDLLKSLRDFLRDGGRLTIPDNVPINIRYLIYDLWKEAPAQRSSFLRCRKIIRQELLISCGSILRNDPTADSNMMELPGFAIEADEEEEQIISLTQIHKKYGWLRNFAFISIVAAFIIASVVATILIIRNFSSQSRESENETSSSVPGAKYIKLLESPGRGYAQFCSRPDGVGAVLFTNYSSGYSYTVQIYDFVTGFAKIYYVQRPDEHSVKFTEKMVAFSDVIAVRSTLFIIVLAAVGNAKGGFDGYTLFSYVPAPDENLYIVDTHAIHQSNKRPYDKKFIHQDEAEGIYCIFYFYSERSFAEVNELETNFFIVQFFVSEQGLISTKNLFSPQSIKGLWSSPFIRSEALYWPLKLTGLYTGISGENFVKLSFNDSETSLVEAPMANWRLCPMNDVSNYSWHYAVQIDGSIIYYFNDLYESVAVVCYVDFVDMAWRQLPLYSLIDNDSIIVKYVRMSRSTVGRLLIHGETRSENTYIAIMDYRALKELAEQQV